MKKILDHLGKYGYGVFRTKITKKKNNDLFDFFLSFCRFYCPSIFKYDYKKKWIDKDFNNSLIYLRSKDKKIFSAIYNSFARSSALYQFCYESKLNSLAANILDVNESTLGVRDPVLRIDVPEDKRNVYGWHQDSAYSNLHINPKNEIIFWIPLINTVQKNGTLVVKPYSHNIHGNVSYLKSKGGKFTSKQYLIKDNYLKKFKSKSIDVKANSVLASYANLFHKSGNNRSNLIRFTIIVRYYKILVEDYRYYRDNKSNINNFK